MIHTVKGFGIVNKVDTDVFLELSCFFYDLADVGNLISGSSALPRSGVVTKSARLQWRRSGQEELPHLRGAAAAWAQEGRNELLHVQGQKGRP